MEPFTGKGRNVTTDNFFTSLQLAEHLKAKNTSIVGTMNRARKEIPPQIKTWKGQLYDTHLLKNKDTTLTIYQSKKNKTVFILSSLHRTV